MVSKKSNIQFRGGGGDFRAEWPFVGMYTEQVILAVKIMIHGVTNLHCGAVLIIVN